MTARQVARVKARNGQHLVVSPLHGGDPYLVVVTARAGSILDGDEGREAAGQHRRGGCTGSEPLGGVENLGGLTARSRNGV